MCPYAEIIALITAILLIPTMFTACNRTVVATHGNTVPTTQNSAPAVSANTANSITVGYSSDDSLNPFFMTTDLNQDLISLIYEPLFYIDDSFCAVNALAVSYAQNGTELTVKLDNTAAFSDGIQCSSADVVYSFNKAKTSANYQNELSVVAAAAAVAADTVVFTLTADCKNAVDSLSFPIVKTSTAEDKTAKPLGTGLYSMNAAGEELQLIHNIYCRRPTPSIKNISLAEIPTSSTLMHTLELGKITAYFDDMSAGSYSQASAASTKTNLPNLVFLGMNSNSYGLNSAAFRQAVYYSVNRQSIVKNSFKKCAVEAYTPYHPDWHVLEKTEFDTSSLSLDYSAAKNLLKNAGFSGTINANLIVYSGNNFKVAAAKEIKENLANIGINVTITELTWDSYMQALSNGDYDFYIGEIKLPLNMRLNAIFSTPSAVYGLSATDTTANAYAEFEKGNISLNAFTESFLQNMPFAPICFRTGTLVYSKNITPAADCDVGNTYKNIHEWTITN